MKRSTVNAALHPESPSRPPPKQRRPASTRTTAIDATAQPATVSGAPMYSIMKPQNKTPTGETKVPMVVIVAMFTISSPSAPDFAAAVKRSGRKVNLLAPNPKMLPQK